MGERAAAGRRPASRSSRRRRTALGLAALLLAGATAAPRMARAEPVRARVLRELEVEATTDGGWLIRVRFNVPIRYLRHLPGRRGDVLRIDIERLLLGPGTPPAPGPGGREALRPPPEAAAAPLLEVIYEDDGGAEGNLEVRFARRVGFRVAPGADSRSLEIHVEPQQAPGSTGLAERAAALAEALAAPGLAPTDPEATKLLDEARRAITADELDRAIPLLRKAGARAEAVGDTAAEQAARELLGVVHERRGQRAHARAEYEAYLARWPEGPGASRVRQRLEALLTAAAEARPPLRETAREGAAEPTRYDFYGSVSGTYSRVQAIRGADRGRVFDSSLFTDTSLIGRMETPRLVLRGEAFASYRFDFIDGQTADDTRISNLFVDVATPERTLAATIGRQSRSNGGVLGRFDGVQAEARIGADLVVSALAGLLVDGPSTTKISTDRPVFGAALDVERLLGLFDGQVFFSGQTNQGHADRMAFGAELRHVAPGRFAIGFVDYDVLFGSLNTAHLSGNLTLFERFTLHALAEVRNTPVLTLENALIGQPGVRDIDHLSQLFSERALRHLAEDRTARTYTASTAVTHRTTDRLQLAGDVTITRTGPTPASGGVAAVPGFGPDVAFGAQVLFNDLTMPGDFAVLGLRYLAGEAVDTLSWNGSLRIPVADTLRATFRLRGDHRKGGGGVAPIDERIAMHPSVRLDWRGRDLLGRLDLVLDAELGLDWTKSLRGSTTPDELGYFGLLVVRWDF